MAVLDGRECTKWCVSCLTLNPYHLDLCLAQSRFSNDFWQNEYKNSGVSLKGDVSTKLKLMSEFCKEIPTSWFRFIIKMYAKAFQLLQLFQTFGNHKTRMFFANVGGEWSTKLRMKENKFFTGKRHLLGLGWHIGHITLPLVAAWGLPFRDSRVISGRSVKKCQLIGNVCQGHWSQGWWTNTSQNGF